MNETDRNLKPHKAAKAAMWMMGSRYSQQSGGSMDFWDNLSDGDKDMCRQLVKDIMEAPKESHNELAARRV